MTERQRIERLIRALETDLTAIVEQEIRKRVQQALASTRTRMSLTHAQAVKASQSQTPIASLRFSVRALGVLRRERIDFLEELATRTPAELLRWRNFGNGSLREIRGVLGAQGLRLREEENLERPAPSVRALPPLGRRSKERIAIHDLRLSLRTARALRHARISFLDRLAGRDSAELLKWPNFGRTSLAELERVLAQHGFSLRGRPPPSAKRDWRDDYLAEPEPHRRAPLFRKVLALRRKGLIWRDIGKRLPSSRGGSLSLTGVRVLMTAAIRYHFHLPDEAMAVRVALNFGQMPTLDPNELAALRERGERLLDKTLSRAMGRSPT
jgi:hypothetical protein